MVDVAARAAIPGSPGLQMVMVMVQCFVFTIYMCLYGLWIIDEG